MQEYNETVWKNDETYLNEGNMNKIENQLKLLTSNLIIQITSMNDVKEQVKSILTTEQINALITSKTNSFLTSEQINTLVEDKIEEYINEALEGDY